MIISNNICNCIKGRGKYGLIGNGVAFVYVSNNQIGIVIFADKN